MRLIFASLASHGHTYPLLPLAFAAKEAGNEVIFATGENFLPPLRKAGLEVAAVGLPIRAAFEQLLGSSELPGPEQRLELGSQVFGEILPRRVAGDLEGLLAIMRPDLVVHERMNPGAAIAAKKAGIPALCHGFGRESVSPMSVGMETRFAAVAAEYGVDVPERYPFTLGNRYVDICPPSLQAKEFKAAAERVELRPVAWNEPGDLPAGVRERSRPLVYLTLGTAMGSAVVLNKAIDGLAKLPVDVLVASGPSVDQADLADLPDNVRLESWVPQADLLPYVDLVVHHGGSGTTLGALAAGKPQLFIPQGADQFTNAEAVLEAGAGAQLLVEELSPDSVTELARGLLADEAIQAGARRFKDEIAAMPSPRDVALRLTELV